MSALSGPVRASEMLADELTRRGLTEAAGADFSDAEAVAVLEALGIRKGWTSSLHPRGRGGKFAPKLGPSKRVGRAAGMAGRAAGAVKQAEEMPPPAPTHRKAGPQQRKGSKRREHEMRMVKHGAYSHPAAKELFNGDDKRAKTAWDKIAAHIPTAEMNDMMASLEEKGGGADAPAVYDNLDRFMTIFQWAHEQGPGLAGMINSLIPPGLIHAAEQPEVPAELQAGD